MYDLHKNVLFQLTFSREETKGGVTPDQVVQLIRHCDELPKITVEGLMTFPPLGTPEESREYFRALKVLRDELKTEKTPLHHLSMGTSHDFPIAIEEGATWVRVGSALFGERS